MKAESGTSRVARWVASYGVHSLSMWSPSASVAREESLSWRRGIVSSVKGGALARPGTHRRPFLWQSKTAP